MPGQHHLMEQFLKSPAGSGAIAGDRVAWRRRCSLALVLTPGCSFMSFLSLRRAAIIISALGEKVEPLCHSPDWGREPSPTLSILFLLVSLITMTPEIRSDSGCALVPRPCAYLPSVPLSFSLFLGWPSLLCGEVLDQSVYSKPLHPSIIRG